MSWRAQTLLARAALAAVAGCGTGAAAGSDGGTADGGAVDGGPDAGGESAPETADAGRDAAPFDAPPRPAQYGIPCGDAGCAPGDACCCVSGDPVSQQCLATDTGPGPACIFGAAGDGAEDCAAGEQCCGPSGAIVRTYCNPGGCPASPMLCHEDVDCGEGGLCCPVYDFGWPHSACLSSEPACPW